jgi:hypothetical protein
MCETLSLEGLFKRYTIRASNHKGVAAHIICGEGVDSIREIGIIQQQAANASPFFLQILGMFKHTDIHVTNIN